MDTNGAIDAGTYGIKVDHKGTGNVIATANASITAADNGIDLDHSGTGKVTATAGDAINASKTGIKVDHEGDGDVEITSNGVISAGTSASLGAKEGYGIYGRTVDGSLKITSNGVVEAGRDGIVGWNHSTDATDTTSINVNDRVGGVYQGVHLDHQAGGLASVRLGANAIISGKGAEGVLINSHYDSAAVLVEGANAGVIYGDTKPYR